MTFLVTLSKNIIWYKSNYLMDLELGYAFWEPEKNGDEVRFSFYSYFELIEYWNAKLISNVGNQHFRHFITKYRI